MALQGPSGSGKTYSSLLLGFGLVGIIPKFALLILKLEALIYMHIWENLLLSKFLNPILQNLILVHWSWQKRRDLSALS